MNQVTLHCFYSQSSPFTYLGQPLLRDIVRRHSANLILKPYDFHEAADHNGGVGFRVRPKARQQHFEEEIHRWAKYYGVRMNVWPKHFHMHNEPPHWNKYPGWMVIAAQLEQQSNANNGKAVSIAFNIDPVFELSHALLRALWTEQRDILNPAVRVEIANMIGFDGAKLQSMEMDAEVQAVYARNTEEALGYGVFGAPTIVLDGERFWGQDRFQFLERAILARTQA